MHTKVAVFLGFLCLSVVLSKSVAQEARPETNTSLVWSPVFNEGSEFHTPTNKPSDLPTNGHDVLQLDPVIERSSHDHHHGHMDPTFKGFWTKKIVWRPRWVKTWQEKKVYIAVWKRMWGPVVVKEWVPVPKPPPGWVKHDSRAPSYVVKKFHGK
ncbi:uncharacterized protein LOC113228726 isoform X2 [Hyposmocoma kahamanoa]|uniref:uncharacterized protein LOC113228726 isoform X2 n=1 Tax=Hyposmocoma kahamanoa TaxID=1477025 RepID=UPI000E6D986A|nr:uncharacterized protein LOC113228726 isoform X2 [Hyposmocoma kahamanoa]